MSPPKSDCGTALGRHSNEFLDGFRMKVGVQMKERRFQMKAGGMMKKWPDCAILYHRKILSARWVWTAK